LHFDYASARAPTSSKRPAPTATRGSSYTAPLPLRFLYSFNEANDLAELLHAEHPHITEDLLRQVYKNRKARFIQFIRHILGIEILKSFPETVTDAFEQFIQQHSNLSSRQLDFLSLLKNFVIEREKVEKKDLINAPFTVIHPQGIRGVFAPTEINEILLLTEKLAA